MLKKRHSFSAEFRAKFALEVRAGDIGNTSTGDIGNTYYGAYVMEKHRTDDRNTGKKGPVFVVKCLWEIL
jgi:sialic acid synthase SpsE